MYLQALCNVFAGPVQSICKPLAVYFRPCALYLQALCSAFAGPVQCICRPSAVYLQALCTAFAGPENTYKYGHNRWALHDWLYVANGLANPSRSPFLNGFAISTHVHFGSWPYL